MEIIWTEGSLARLEEVGAFIAKDSPGRAADFINELIDSVERLRAFPLSGGLCPENPAFRQMTVQGYRIIYRVKEKSVEIITVISPGLRSGL
jgi:addiction module RelE/StbE family toxin